MIAINQATAEAGTQIGITDLAGMLLIAVLVAIALLPMVLRDRRRR